MCGHFFKDVFVGVIWLVTMRNHRHIDSCTTLNFLFDSLFQQFPTCISAWWKQLGLLVGLMTISLCPLMLPHCFLCVHLDWGKSIIAGLSVTLQSTLLWSHHGYIIRPDSSLFIMKQAVKLESGWKKKCTKTKLSRGQMKMSFLWTFSFAPFEMEEGFWWWA